ncbi:MAG: hypothetical protein JJ850_16495 [Kordiimonadaceae bacterium]|nr:hypothetical protein [Kordiimonadaceae bacterium]MBO6569689.1 hypothetical protein [Kordiimonadaceae bacterium]MBO6966224.1 hypothetical protein [Kordiimonadaceae bacterium]
MSPMPKLKRLIVLRNTPDWAANSALWQSEKRLDPSQFMPDPLPPGFPVDTEQLILNWNSTFADDFFAVRQTIKEIALEQFKKSRPDEILTQREFEQDMEPWLTDTLIHFSDDDDFAAENLFDATEQPLKTGGIARWPSPVLGNTLVNRRAEKHFLKLRFWLHRKVRLYPAKLAFLKPLITGGESIASIENEPCYIFFQTNNYMLNPTGLSPERVVSFLDHLRANRSFRAEPIRLVTLSDQYLSICNKLPTSITMLRNIMNSVEKAEWHSAIEREIRQMAGIEFPEELVWVSPVHRELVDYFLNTVIKELT